MTHRRRSRFCSKPRLPLLRRFLMAWCCATQPIKEAVRFREGPCCFGTGTSTQDSELWTLLHCVWVISTSFVVRPSPCTCIHLVFCVAVKLPMLRSLCARFENSGSQGRDGIQIAHGFGSRFGVRKRQQCHDPRHETVRSLLTSTTRSSPLHMRVMKDNHTTLFTK